MKKFIYLAFGMVFVNVLVLQVLAHQWGERGRWRSGCSVDDSDRRPGKWLREQLQELSITEEQKQQIARILLNARPQALELFSELRDRRQDLVGMVMGQNLVDEVAIRDHSDRLAETQAVLALMAADVWQQIRLILSSDQLAKIDELRSETNGRLAGTFGFLHIIANEWIDDHVQR